MIEYIDWHPAPRGAASCRRRGSGRPLRVLAHQAVVFDPGAPVSIRLDADRIAVIRQE